MIKKKAGVRQAAFSATEPGESGGFVRSNLRGEFHHVQTLGRAVISVHRINYT